MDGKGVKKLPNGVEKFGVLDHFSADLDGICLGITGVNDPFRLRADAHRLSKLAQRSLFRSRQKLRPLHLA